MPYVKCSTCGVKRYVAPGRSAEDHCPLCRGPLEPVTDTHELTGLRSVGERARSGRHVRAGAIPRLAQRRIAARVAEIMARRSKDRLSSTR